MKKLLPLAFGLALMASSATPLLGQDNTTTTATPTATTQVADDDVGFELGWLGLLGLLGLAGLRGRRKEETYRASTATR